MRKRSLALVAGLLSCLLAASSVVNPPAAAQGRARGRAPAGFAVGQVFPPLTLPSADDRRPVSLGDFRGRKVILHIFASW